ncbi:latrophilin receptor-like protein A [Patiria miniata]|uniref:G-protein coupled receptors family 2 profile 2 domain-containing protein n=1 Tax=Patiria miniata TaxID=46514 RepID=A0A913YYH4_PATMI|nr:latrophilin receptor-like protein A [Patiria miniata]
MFVYFMSTGELVAPVKIERNTSYITRRNDTTKSTLIRVCGERPSNLTCKTLNDDDANEIANQDAKVMLASGETLVCFSTLDQDVNHARDPFTFSNPELVINMVGFSLSMAGLVVTLSTYCVFPSLRNVHGQAIMSLSLTIFFGQLSSTLSSIVVKPSHQGLCTAVAITTHYAWLAMFAWMAVISWDFMRTFTTAKPAATKFSDRRKFLRMCLFGWCSPMLIIVPNLVLYICECTGVDFTYGDEVACWMLGSFKLAVLHAPILLCICFNILCFVLTVRGIRASKKASAMLNNNMPRAQIVWRELVIYAKITSLLSFAWILGFIAMVSDLQVLWYLFTIFSSLQGFFVFLSFAFNGQVRALWRDKVRQLHTSLSSSPSTSATAAGQSHEERHRLTELDTQV